MARNRQMEVGGKMIPKEILNRYYMQELEIYKQWEGDTIDTERTFYQTFLIQTDHIPNKIVEELIENLADATLSTFAGVFIKFLADVRIKYKDVLQYRKLARQKINELEKLN